MAINLTDKKDLLSGGFLMFLLVGLQVFSGSITVSITSKFNTESTPVLFWSVVILEICIGLFSIYKGLSKK